MLSVGHTLSRSPHLVQERLGLSRLCRLYVQPRLPILRPSPSGSTPTNEKSTTQREDKGHKGVHVKTPIEKEESKGKRHGGDKAFNNNPGRLNTQRSASAVLAAEAGGLYRHTPGELRTALFSPAVYLHARGCGADKNATVPTSVSATTAVPASKNNGPFFAALQT